MPRLAAATLAAAVTLLVGCGNERVGSGRLFETDAGQATRGLSYPEAGLSLKLPKEFEPRDSTRPQLFRASFRESFVAGYAYRRTEQIPQTPEQLAAARRRLVAAATKRDKSFRLRRSRVTMVGGAPAVELLGDQTIFNGRLRLRSLHVYKGNGEYVVELVAPVAIFGRLDRATFPVIRRTLRVTGNVKPPRKPTKRKPGAKPGKGG